MVPTPDRSDLPEAEFEFVVLPDTHYMLESVTDVEFESRRHQTARVGHAIEVINALDPAFVVHLGDVVQEFPETDAFDAANEAARDQLEALAAPCHHVAGNHDVGDKPDPTMPTDPITAGRLRAFHVRFGPSWDHWRHGGYEFVTVNSQLLNAGLPAADEQRGWLESTLRNATDPVVAFTHLPPFLHDPEEPARGHYDNVAEPARSWLLDCLGNHGVEALFAGHSHFAFHNRIDDLDVRVLPSPSFTRPGFSELFSSCPPPERARDDRPKLGVHLLRVVDGDLRVHFLRTGGATGPDAEPPGRRLLTRRTRGLSDSPLGASLVHPIVETAEVPAVFPSAIRQCVHNDYPTLASLELGLGCLRTPLEDLQKDLRRRKLATIRRAGGTVVGTTRGNRDHMALTDHVDEVELRLLGSAFPTAESADRVATLREAGCPVGLSTTVPGRAAAGKQHDRFRTGYDPSTLVRLDTRLADLGTDIDRVLCALDCSDPWEAIDAAPTGADLDHVGVVDWHLDATTIGDRSPAGAVAAATAAVAAESSARLYVEPLRELDRTLDTAVGLLDRQCNPTEVFRAVRSLNTLLFAGGGEWGRAGTTSREGLVTYGLTGPGGDLWLVLPDATRTVSDADIPGDLGVTLDRGPTEAVDLATGRVRSRGSNGSGDTMVELGGPAILRSRP
jgi:hypothetical protein